MASTNEEIYVVEGEGSTETVIGLPETEDEMIQLQELDAEGEMIHGSEADTSSDGLTAGWTVFIIVAAILGIVVIGCTVSYYMEDTKKNIPPSDFNTV